MPQLHFQDFPPQLVWLAITFVVLYLLMSKVALPKIGQVLDARAVRIADDLDRATKLKDEAAGVLAAYEKALADARAQAQATIKAVSERMQKDAEAREGALAKKLVADTEAAEGRIKAARDQAMASLSQVAAEITRAAAEKLIGQPVNDAVAQAAVAAAAKERA
ncbi:MAG: F0F1 ATP synthase subunit B' [Alphaproteobacteria bacterium]|nr:F0F1 ATP synthase subunit B' [Alphaproteobacteria bacterium]